MTKENEFKVEININPISINLGIRKRKNPKDDRHQYLEITKMDISMFNDNISIIPKEFVINEYPVQYCDDCLLQGKRTRKLHTQGGKQGENGQIITYGYCREHYKQRNPDKICPKCKSGIFHFGTCDNYCDECGYWEPHVHNHPRYGIHISGDMPVLGGYSTSNFLCSCTDWETPKENKKRREELKSQTIE